MKNNNFIYNKNQKLEIQKNKKNKRARIILFILMIIWTLGSLFSFFLIGNFALKSASASTLDDANYLCLHSYNKFYYGSRVSTVKNGHNVLYENDYNCLFFYGNVSGYTSTSVSFSFSNFSDLEGNSNYKYLFCFYLQNLSDYSVQVSFLLNSQTYLCSSYCNDGYNALLVDLSSYSDINFLEVYFYFYSPMDLEEHSADILIQEIGFYSSFDNNNPLTVDSPPVYTPHLLTLHSYAYNVGYNTGYYNGYDNGYDGGYQAGYNDMLSVMDMGIFQGMSIVYSSSDGSCSKTYDPIFINGGVSCPKEWFLTFGSDNNLIQTDLALGEFFDFTQTFKFRQPFSLSNVELLISAPYWNGNLTRSFTLVCDNGLSYIVDLPQIFIDGKCSGVYTLNLENVCNCLSEQNIDFSSNILINSIICNCEYISGNFSNHYVTQITNSKDTFYNGYNNGYLDGYGAGESDIMSTISEQLEEEFSRGYNDGYYTGHSVGYTSGVNDSNDYTFFGLISAVVDAPVQALTGLLDFDLLGFNMANFFFSLLTLCLIIIVVRLILAR